MRIKDNRRRKIKKSSNLENCQQKKPSSSPAVDTTERESPLPTETLSVSLAQPALSTEVTTPAAQTSVSPSSSTHSAIKIDFDNRIKRKNVLALNEKVAAIREYDKTSVYKHVGRLFNCSPDQIKRIVRQRNQILAAWEQRTRRCQNAKTLEMKMVRVSMLGKAVYEYIRRMMYYQDFMITNGFLQKWALNFKSVMGIKNFFPHEDWCDKFRATYKIKTNDTRLLPIAHTQGYSVQPKDIVNDVLTECSSLSVSDESTTPTPTPCSREKTNKSKNDSGNFASNETEGGVSKILDIRAMPSGSKQRQVFNNSPTITSKLSDFQPLRELLTLPLENKNSTGTTRKVLLATPINPRAKPQGKANALTMTIIPLSSLTGSGAPKAAQQSTETAKPAGQQQTMPAPMVNVKQEIKEEPVDDEYEYDDDFQACIANFVKPEMLSDMDEENIDEENDVAAAGQENSNDSVVVLEETRTQPTMKRKSPVTTTALNGITTKKQRLMTGNIKEGDNLATAVTKVNNNKSSNNDNNNNNRCNENSTNVSKIKSCGEARRYLKLLEDFAHQKESLRLVGLITRADEVLREMDENRDRDNDLD